VSEQFSAVAVCNAAQAEIGRLEAEGILLSREQRRSILARYATRAAALTAEVPAPEPVRARRLPKTIGQTPPKQAPGQPIRYTDQYFED